MVIGIDAREGAKSRRAGKGEYVYQLITALIPNTQHQLVLFLDQDPPAEWKKSNVRCLVWKISAWAWQWRVFWYLELLRPVDVYLATTSLIIPALVRSVPIVTALMDFVSFLFPDQHNLKAVVLEKIWMRPALRYSRKLIAISENTKQDAVRLFRVEPHKITVTYLAASFSQDTKTYPLPRRPIILFVGTFEPRKNLERVIAAFNQIKPLVPEALLILVGHWGWQSQAIKQAIQENPYQADIKILTDVDNSQKRSVYQQAKVLVFPSLYEGFGLPPLEAMACGVPVITSRSSSLPEVVGDAGILVDPTSVGEIADALQKILLKPELAIALGQQGQIRAAQFTWSKTALRTLKILEDVGK